MIKVKIPVHRSVHILGRAVVKGFVIWRVVKDCCKTVKRLSAFKTERLEYEHPFRRRLSWLRCGWSRVLLLSSPWSLDGRIGYSQVKPRPSRDTLLLETGAWSSSAATVELSYVLHEADLNKRNVALFVVGRNFPLCRFLRAENTLIQGNGVFASRHWDEGHSLTQWPSADDTIGVA